jgi:hypothetical protein
MAKMTVYVPDDLKGRMDKVEGVNWSPLACRAFEAKLAELITKQGAKDMSDVITRLKASKAEAGDANRTMGREMGDRWASSSAEAEELGRLEAWAEGDWEEQLEDSDPNAAFGPSHHLVDVIEGGHAGRSDSDEFWTFFEDMYDLDPEYRWKHAFLVGFVEGALEVWSKVKDQI